MQKLFKTVASRLYLTPQSRRCRNWFAVDGDNTLRMEYNLNADSIVFDLGGYLGQWSSDIFSRYACCIYIFEPVPGYAEKIEKRFRKNPKIKTFPFGLAEATKKVRLALDNDSSSMLKNGGNAITVDLQCVKHFFDQHNIERVDLIKINIEGAEYDLMEFMIDAQLQTRLIDIQVQFHDFVPDAQNRMERIRSRLSETHVLTWSYPFVWENWRLKNDTIPKDVFGKGQP